MNAEVRLVHKMTRLKIKLFPRKASLRFRRMISEGLEKIEKDEKFRRRTTIEVKTIKGSSKRDAVYSTTMDGACQRVQTLQLSAISYVFLGR